MDDSTPNKPIVPTVSIKPSHDDGPTSSMPLPDFNQDHGTLLGVSWQMCHAWNTHETASRAVLGTNRLHYMWNYPS